MKRHKIASILMATLSLILLVNMDMVYGTNGDTDEDGQGYMKFDSEDLKRGAESWEKGAIAEIDPEEVEKYKGVTGVHFDLLSHLNYVPAARNQGVCGNCWVWAGTGIVEVALDVQEGIYDRLSVQYFDSCYSAAWACCGGFLEWYADWTELEGFVIPWSNTNAQYQDGGRTCAMGSSLVACGSIATTPQYPLTQCDDLYITTTGVTSATAIANIKAILHSDKAVWFAFWLTDFNNFRNHWNGQPETAIWNPATGGEWGVNSGAHAVLCVGYDDTNPDTPYWIVVNSWGTTATRPNGIFRLSMNMDYEGQYSDYPYTYWSFQFATLDVVFDIPEPAPVGGVYTIANKLALVAPWAGLCTVIATIAIITIGVRRRNLNFF